MANKWTVEQLDAITERGCNLLVAAAAGAGKTAVLVERIIRKITDREKPVDIDKLLVVTFTNAAATEMRERIGNALAAALENDPASDNLQRQMALLDRASIMTIHSFCLEVVRGHFHALGLDPAFRIADETETTLMKLEVLDKLFEDKYENEPEDSPFFKLVESYGGGRDDSAFRDIVLNLHRFTRSSPWPEQWLAAQAEAYSPRASACLSSTPWARVLLRSAAAELQGLTALLKKAAARASRAQGLEPYCGVLADDMQQLEGLLDICTRALNACGETDNNLVDINHTDSMAAGDSADGASITDNGDTEDSADSVINTVNTDSMSSTVGGEGTVAFDAKDMVGTLCGACDSDDANSYNTKDIHPNNSPVDWDTIHAAFSSYQPARLPRCSKDSDPEAQDEVKEVRGIVKEKVKKLCECGFNETAEEIRADFEKIYPLFSFMASLVNEFDELYSLKKKDKGLVDFNDLEHYCLKILLKDGEPTEAAKELRQKYEEILIDEYQDSNLIQELILGTVSGNQDGIHNLFMVGDVKQSIYRFRQAKPELFLSKYASYPREKGFDSRAITLYRNFRSRAQVIDGVNFIFRQIMSETVGELDYTEKEALNPGAVFEEPEFPCQTGGPVELNIIDTASDEEEMFFDKRGINGECAVSGETVKLKTDTQAAAADSSDESEEEIIDNIQTEARIVGKRILSLTSNTDDGLMVYDKMSGGYRHAQYRDIVILMRATKGWADVFTDELAAMGIPAYADVGLGYFRTVEVDTMLSLLQIIDNPMQDIPMLAVLRSPICGFSADELAEIRLADRNVSIYEAMKLLIGADKQEDFSYGCEGAYKDTSAGTYEAFCRGTGRDTGIGTGEASREGTYKDGAEGSGEVSREDSYEASREGTGKDTIVRQKTEKFLRKLWQWRSIAGFLPTDELVWKLMNETGYYSYVGVLPGGPERQANLRMLFERARQYEETSYKGLFNFINFINKLKSSGGDMGSAKILGENDNVVRIMSIHKSKGLEFPVVFVSGCGKRFNLRDLNENILLHQDLGFGPDVVDLEKRTITASLPKYAIYRKLKLETLSEEMRILYVAFTRAKEKLILTGCVADVEKACAKWCKIADTADEKLPSYDMQQAATYLDWLGPAVARHESALPIRMAAAPWGGINTIKDENSQWEVRILGKGAASFEKEAAAANENIRKWLAEVNGQDEADSGEGGSDNAKRTDGALICGIKESKCGQKGTEGEADSSCHGAEKAESHSPDTNGPETMQKAELNEAELIRCLEWQYPGKRLTTVPAKLSVTELKRRFTAENDEEAAAPFMRRLTARPAFMEKESDISGAAKGTIMHFVMQHLDLERLKTVRKATESGTMNEGLLSDEIKSQIEKMVENEQLTKPEADTVKTYRIVKFFSTDLGRRMLMSETVNRETAFNIQIKCSEIYKELSGGPYDDEVMLLQGVIDCWFMSDDGIVLIDYKTDYVPEGGEDSIRERYRIQLDYYTRALEKITGEKVKERYLYLFYTGGIISC